MSKITHKLKAKSIKQNGSAILGVGQLANNRTGLTINTEFQLPLFKINLDKPLQRDSTRFKSIDLWKNCKWRYIF